MIRRGRDAVRFRGSAAGLKVVSVFENSPASETGIAAGDVILGIDDHLGSALDAPRT